MRENNWKTNGFRRLQKTGKVCADVMSDGRLFQSRLPATAKARSPTVTSLDLKRVATLPCETSVFKN